MLSNARSISSGALGIDSCRSKRRNFPSSHESLFTHRTGLDYDRGDYELPQQQPRNDRLCPLREDEEARADGQTDRIGISTYVEICTWSIAGMPGRGWGVPPCGLSDRKYTVLTGASPHARGRKLHRTDSRTSLGVDLMTSPLFTRYRRGSNESNLWQPGHRSRRYGGADCHSKAKGKSPQDSRSHAQSGCYKPRV